MSSEARTLLKELARVPLSESLRKTLLLAQRLENPEFACWCQLELAGYVSSNPSLTSDTVVPVYRTVAGQFSGISGEPLVFSSGQDFSQMLLRNGIEELETLPKSQGMVAIQDARLCELIKEQHNVEVYWYRFSTIQLVAVFSAIRVELWNKLAELDPVGMPQVPLTAREDIMQPLQNSDWFGVNLREFWRRLKGTSKA